MARRIFLFEGTKWDNIPSKMYCTCSLSFSSLVIKRCLILFSVCRIIFICELSAFVSIVHDIVMRVSKYCSIIIIIIPSKFFFLFIGREPRLFSVDFLTEQSDFDKRSKHYFLCNHFIKSLLPIIYFPLLYFLITSGLCMDIVRVKLMLFTVGS